LPSFTYSVEIDYFHWPILANVVEWTDDLVHKLIELYEQHPWLYDVSTADFRNKGKKRAYEEEITAQLGIPGT